MDVFLMENPIKIDDLGVPMLGNLHPYIYIYIYIYKGIYC